MRLLFLLLIVLVGLIQYPLWMGRGGWLAVWDLKTQVTSQKTVNEGLRARNQALDAEVVDLREGTSAAEEKARAELGMMHQSEIYVQILPPDVHAPEIKAQAKGKAQGGLLMSSPTPAVSPASSKPPQKAKAPAPATPSR
jgi:cell division protein FtsB